MASQIHIALIDDDMAVLDSTRLVLRGEGIEATPFASAEAFLNSPQTHRDLHCVVTDVRMPGMSGLDLLAELRARHIMLPLILITGHGEVSMAVAALKSGASDFIEKPFDAAVLAASIRQAVQVWESDAKNEKARQETIERAKLLSARQREVMYLVADGYSNKQIAAKLGISARTVETYRLWVMEKMGAGSLAALVRMVLVLPADAAGDSTNAETDLMPPPGSGPKRS